MWQIAVRAACSRVEGSPASKALWAAGRGSLGFCDRVSLEPASGNGAGPVASFGTPQAAPERVAVDPYDRRAIQRNLAYAQMSRFA
jgi:hypothetical protein